MSNFFRLKFCLFKKNDYFCIDTTSNLIYIYHFPRGDAICEDGFPFLLSPSEFRTGDSCCDCHIKAFGMQAISMEIRNQKAFGDMLSQLR